MTSPSRLHLSLLRPPVLHILRSAGFTSTKPSVLDTVVDLTSRYLILLASRTAVHARSHSALDGIAPHESDPWEAESVQLTDIRLALQDVGALHPFVGEMQEERRGDEDMRGVESFVRWCQGKQNAEIRRVAGMSKAITSTDEAVAAATITGGGEKAAEAEAEALAMLVSGVDGRQDFLTLLKRKHAKTKEGEDARYAGTILGHDDERKEVVIEGGEYSREPVSKTETGGDLRRADTRSKDIESIKAWEARLMEKLYDYANPGDDMNMIDVPVDEIRSESSGSPLTDISPVQSPVT